MTSKGRTVADVTLGGYNQYRPLAHLNAVVNSKRTARNQRKDLVEKTKLSFLRNAYGAELKLCQEELDEACFFLFLGFFLVFLFFFIDTNLPRLV